MSLIDRISVNTQSSIRIESDTVIYIDPFQISMDSHDADLILITHAHPDHFDLESIKKVWKEGTIMLLPVSMKEDIKAANLPVESVCFAKPADKLEEAGISIEVVPAYNMDKPMHPKSNQWCGYLISVENQIVYVSGDTDVIPEMKKISCDIALIPVGGTFTMNEEEAARMINEMAPQAVIPLHYGSFINDEKAGERFSAQVKDEIEVVLKLFQ